MRLHAYPHPHSKRTAKLPLRILSIGTTALVARRAIQRLNSPNCSLAKLFTSQTVHSQSSPKQRSPQHPS